MLSFNLSTYAPDVHLERIRWILRDSYGILNAKITQLTGYEDKNFLLEGIEFSRRKGPQELILKISNPVEANCPGHIEFQERLCDALNREGVPCPKTFPRLDGRSSAMEKVTEEAHLPVRLFYVLPGKILEKYDFSPELVSKVAATLARFHSIVDGTKLKTSHIPFISAENSTNLMKEAEFLEEKGIILEDQKVLVQNALRQYEDLYNLNPNFDRGLIHSDFNETNVLVEEEGEEVGGVLDFGDVHEGPRAMDIATLILYLHLSDRLQQSFSVLTQNVLRGYETKREFRDSQESLLICMRTRMACSLLYGLRTARMRGDNSDDYVLKTQSNGWKALETLSSLKTLES